MKGGKARSEGGGKGGFNPYRDAKGRFASAPGGGAKPRKAAAKSGAKAGAKPGGKTGSKKKTYAAPALSQTDQPKGLKTKRSLAAKATAAKKKAAAQQVSAQLAASRDALSQRAAAAKSKTKAQKAQKAEAAKDKGKPKSNIIPFIRKPQTGHSGLDAIVTAAGFLARSHRPRGAELRAKLARGKRQQRRTKVQIKVAKNFGNPAKNFAKPKPPGLRSQAQRVKQQNKAKAATDRAKLKSLKPKQFITPFARSNKNASPAQKLFETMRQTDKVTLPFGHTRIPARKLMKRSVTQAKLRTKATKGVLKKGQGIIQSVTTRPRNPKKRKRKEK